MLLTSGCGCYDTLYVCNLLACCLVTAIYVYIEPLLCDNSNLETTKHQPYHLFQFDIMDGFTCMCDKINNP